MSDLFIEKDKSYEIIVFPSQDIGIKAQQILATKDVEFKYISNLAVVVPKQAREETCLILVKEGIGISGYYPFLYRDYEEDFFKKARDYRPASGGEFLKSITLCYVAPCIADETKIRLIAYFDRDISEILPYLNAVIKGTSFNKHALTLTYVKSGRVINIYRIKVTMAKVDDIIDAWQILDEMKQLINRTYRDKEKIKPNYEERVKVTALQIYGWLPKTNCGECGELTCLAFAVKLLAREQKLENCKPLFSDPKFAEKKQIMQEMAEALGVA